MKIRWVTTYDAKILIFVNLQFNNLLVHGFDHPLKEIQSKFWYMGLYENLTERTKYRDIKKLEKLKLIEIAPNKNVHLLTAISLFKFQTGPLPEIKRI